MMKIPFCKIIIFLLSLLVAYTSSEAQNKMQQETVVNLVSVVKSTLALSPFVKRQILEISRSKADLQLNQSAFDLQLNSEIGYVQYGSNFLSGDPRNQFANNILNRDGQLSVGVQKQFRNSLIVQTELAWNRKANNLPFDEFQQLELAYLSRNAGNVSISFLQPLLKGRGRNVVTANERAASQIIKAQEANLTQLAARELLTSITVYWQYLAAYQVLEVYQKNENRVKTLLELTQALIDADKKPRAALSQVKADLAEKENQTIQAKQLFLQAQQELQRTMGLDETAILKNPSDQFPSPTEADFSSIVSIETFYNIALQNRTDLQALQIGQEALQDILKARENEVKPQLNLEGTIGYGGLEIGNGAANLLTLFGQEEGRNWIGGLSLSYVFPLQNNQAKAQLSLQNIALQDQAILLENEARNIKINLNIALNNLQQSHASLLKSLEAYQLYQLTYANEQEKFKSGLTTLINVTLFQERLTFSEIQYIQFKKQFAINLTDLRFQTGTLMKAIYMENRDYTSFDFYSIPQQ